MDKCPKCGCGVRVKGSYWDGRPFLHNSTGLGVHDVDGLQCLSNQLASVTANYNERCEQLQTVHRHIAEALEFLGVDTSAEGYAPDTWTLREQCKIAGERMRELSYRLSMLIGYVATCQYENTDQWLDRLQSVLNTCLTTLGDPDRVRRVGYGFEIVKPQDEKGGE